MARGKGIYRRGSVYWIRYAGLDGRMRFESSGSSNFKVAEEKLTERRKAVDDGNDPEPARRIGNHTFGNLATQYLTWAERQKAIRSKRGFIKALKGRFENLPLKHFSTRLVEEYQTQRLSAGNKPAAPVNIEAHDPEGRRLGDGGRGYVEAGPEGEATTGEQQKASLLVERRSPRPHRSLRRSSQTHRHYGSQYGDAEGRDSFP